MENYKQSDEVRVDEESFFVVNLTNDKDFYHKIFYLSELYNQDCFLYKPKYQEDAYLVGTNNSEFPSYNQRVNQGIFRTNIDTEFFSGLKSKTFSFSNGKHNHREKDKNTSVKEEGLRLETKYDYDRMSRMAISSLSENNVRLCEDYINEIKISLNKEKFYNIFNKLNDVNFIEQIDETSRRQKLTKKFLGLDKNIYSIGIITSENPMGNKYSKDVNKERMNDLDNELRKGNYLFYRVKGKYGNIEHPCIIFNISLETLKELGNKYYQESFIYGEFIIDKIGKNNILFQYFERGEKTPYKLLDKNIGYIKFDKDVDDYFTAINKDLPFTIFENVLYNANNFLNERSTNMKYKTRK